MNQKLRAVGIVIGMIVLSTALAVSIKLVSAYISPEMFPVIVTAVGVSVLLYVMYRLVLAHIQYSDQLKSMVDKK